MNSLFGMELPTAVNFVIAFVVVLLLIGVAAWLVRRFGATRLDAARARPATPACSDRCRRRSTPGASSSSSAATTSSIC